MKRNDFILIACLLVAIGVFMLIVNVTTKKGAYAIVKVEGKVVKKLTLSKDTEVIIKGKNGGTNTVMVKGGYVSVIDASCPDLYCKKHKKINKSNETIVCLPNEMVIEITSQKQHEYDSIAQ